MISNRLKSLVKYVEKSDKLIDIGCDHALLDIYLVKHNYINNLIVSDVHKNALQSGIDNIKKYGLENKIYTRLGSGLEVLNDNDVIDTILISGMGTKTILEILNNNYFKYINKLILQSNRDYDILRREVVKLGFYIVQEEVIEDNAKLYINIVFNRGVKKYSDEEIKYGTKNMINKNVYIDYLIQKYKMILNKTSNEAFKNELIKEITYLNNNIKKDF